jgi:hypothetical protein
VVCFSGVDAERGDDDDDAVFYGLAHLATAHVHGRMLGTGVPGLRAQRWNTFNGVINETGGECSFYAPVTDFTTRAQTEAITRGRSTAMLFIILMIIGTILPAAAMVPSRTPGPIPTGNMPANGTHPLEPTHGTTPTFVPPAAEGYQRDVEAGSFETTLGLLADPVKSRTCLCVPGGQIPGVKQRLCVRSLRTEDRVQCGL